MKRSIAWVGIAQAISLVMQFALSVILARLLTPYEMGIFGIAVAMTGLLSVIQVIGMQALIVREEVLTPELTATAFTINAVLSAAIAAAIAGLSFFGGAFLHDRGVRDVLLVLAINPLYGIFTFLPSAHLERRGQFKLLSLGWSVTTLVGTSAIIILAFLRFSYMSMPVGGVIGGAVGVVLFNILAREHVSYRLRLTAWRKAMTFGLQMLTVTGVVIVSERISEIALGRLQGLSALAMFNRASNLNMLLWNNVYYVISRVIFVDFAQLNREGASLRERYLQMVDVLTAILWPTFAGFAVIAGPAIRIIYGSKWLAAAPALSALLVASLVGVANSMSWEMFAATGNLRTQSRLEVLRATTNAATFVAASFFSFTAAAIVRIFDALFGFFLYRPHLDRMTNTSLRDVAPIYWRNAGLTLLTIVPVALLMTRYGMRPDVPVALLCAAVLLSVLLWLGGLAALKHPLIGEGQRIVARLAHALKAKAAPDADAARS